MLKMTPKGSAYGDYFAFKTAGWTDRQLIQHGYAEVDADHYRRLAEELAAHARQNGFTITIKQSMSRKDVDIIRVTK